MSKSAIPPLTIDPEFRRVCPPLSDEEKRRLKIVLMQDRICLDPIIVWEHNGKMVIVDGYHRYEICKANEIPFTIKEMEFESREAVHDWIIRHALGQRNLSELQRAKLFGELYETTKKAGVRPPQSSSDTVSPAKSTTGKIAEEFDVSERTVKRGIATSKDLRKLDGDVEKAVVNKKVPATRKEIAALAELPKKEQTAAVAAVVNGTAKNLTAAMKPDKAADKKAADKKAEPLVDELKRPLDKEFAAVFAEREKYKKAVRLMHEARAIVNELAELPAGCYLHVQSVVAEIGNAVRGIKAGMPFTTCVYCRAKSPKRDKCEACKGAGWIIKALYDNAPAEWK